MFKEAEPGTREVNIERSEEVLEARPDVIAAGCPFCNTMLTDGVKHFNKEGEVVVKALRARRTLRVSSISLFTKTSAVWFRDGRVLCRLCTTMSAP